MKEENENTFMVSLINKERFKENETSDETRHLSFVESDFDFNKYRYEIRAFRFLFDSEHSLVRSILYIKNENFNRMIHVFHLQSKEDLIRSQIKRNLSSEEVKDNLDILGTNIEDNFTIKCNSNVTVQILVERHLKDNKQVTN